MPLETILRGYGAFLLAIIVCLVILHGIPADLQPSLPAMLASEDEDFINKSESDGITSCALPGRKLY